MKRVALLVAAFAALTSCVSQSEVDPNATVTIAGSLARQDGSPAGGVRVSLLREADVGEGLFTFTTLGMACLGDDRTLSSCSHGSDTHTDGSGAFTFTLKGKDTQGFLGNAATLELTSSLPRSGPEYDGPATTYRFQVQTEQLAVALRFWEQRIDATADGDAGRVAYAMPPPTLLPPEIGLDGFTFEARFERAGGEAVWGAPGRDGVAAFDVRTLEGTSGTVALYAYAKARSVPDRLGRAVDVILRTPRMPYRGGDARPASRGVPCFAQTDQGSVVEQNPCPLTDGEFTTSFDPQLCSDAGPSCAPRSASAAIVDMRVSKPALLVVVRGCRGECTVEASNDQTHWTSIGTVKAPMATVTPPHATRARWIRVRASDASALTEISVWDRDLPHGAPSTIIATSAEGVLPPLQRAIDRTTHRLPIVIAVLLAVLALGLLGGFALRRTAAGPR